MGSQREARCGVCENSVGLPCGYMASVVGVLSWRQLVTVRSIAFAGPIFRAHRKGNATLAVSHPKV